MKGLYTTDSKESNLKIYVHPLGSLSCMRVRNRFFRDAGFALLDGRDSGFLSKMGVVLGFKLCTGCGMPKIVIGITGLKEKFGSG